MPEAFVQVEGSWKKEHSFGKERENILYSVAFRNLSAKTQVFHSNVREHLRTRLTHTLEVARIAADMAEELGLDAKLAEAVALGHDLGHTPFGHVGERAIHRFSSGEDRKYTLKDGGRMDMPGEMRGFKHNLQSVRLLVDYTTGCEFSNFVLYGIREHSSTEYKKLGERGRTSFFGIYKKHCGVTLEDGAVIPAWSVEAFLVKWADEVAQRHHDIEDAYFQKIMSPKQIMEQFRELSRFAETEQMKEIYQEMGRLAENYEFLSDRERDMFPHYLAEFVIGIYVPGLIREFRECMKKVAEKYGIRIPGDLENIYTKIQESDVREIFSLKGTEIEKCDKKLNSGLKYAILDSYEVQRMDGRSEYIVRRLLRAYKSNPPQLPEMYINRLMKEELFRFLSDQANGIMEKIRNELGYKIDPGDVEKWHNYECRNALRVLLDDPETETLISPILMRVIFDYVAFMTDRSAYEEYRELYE